MRRAIEGWRTHAVLRRWESELGRPIGRSRVGQLGSPQEEFSVWLQERTGFFVAYCAILEDEESSTSNLSNLISPTRAADKYLNEDSIFSDTPAMHWRDFPLLGPWGPLPNYITERLLRTQQSKDVLSLVAHFTQRLAHLYYGAWARWRPECQTFDHEYSFDSLLQQVRGMSKYPRLTAAWYPSGVQTLVPLLRRLFDVDAKVQSQKLDAVRVRQPACLGNMRLGTSSLGRIVWVYRFSKITLEVTFMPADLALAVRKRSGEKRQQWISALCAVLPGNVTLCWRLPVKIQASKTKDTDPEGGAHRGRWVLGRSRLCGM